MNRIFVFLLLFFIVGFSSDNSADQILGDWLLNGKNVKIHFYKSNNKYYGKIVWMKEPYKNNKPKTDKNNPNTKLRQRELIGLVVAFDFEYKKNNEWSNGFIYDPGSGNTYNGVMNMIEKNKIEIRAFKGYKIFGITQYLIK